MKAISVRQPHASLICPGPDRDPVKTIETQSWPTSHRGPVLICSAAKALPQGLRLGTGRSIVTAEYVVSGTRLLDLCNEEFIDLPRGVALGVATIVDCLHTSDIWWIDPAQYAEDEEDEEHCHIAGWGRNGDTFWIDHDQRPYGDFTPGRFGWVLDNIISFAEPIPVKGRLGLFDPPADVLAQVREQLG